MRTSRWMPSIVPDLADQTVYIVQNDFCRLGRAYAEPTDSEYADLETTITALLEGQYSHPVRNTAEHARRDMKLLAGLARHYLDQKERSKAGDAT